MYRHVYTLYSHCTNMYIQNKCIYIHVSIQTCLDLVHRMYIPGTYMECTNSCVYVQRIQKQKVAFGQGLNPGHPYYQDALTTMLAASL